MDPFNIIVELDGKKIDLNIHPQEEGSYKIVYHGALVGEVYMSSDGESWKAYSADDIDAAGYPIYEFDETSGHANILLEGNIVQEIGQQIRQNVN
ncbi:MULTISPECIES: hypothetical protein [Pedobacter]|uniref:hypothetical protein n=1 Tax=Pedobacter TaxID=84567 RepID=UPI00210C2892|nr:MULTISPECIES: hypothetical protein [unclassified Pedobacter]